MPNHPNANVQQLFTPGASIDGEKALAHGEWMSVQDASNATGLSMGTLRRYIKSKKIQSRRLGRTINSKLEVLVTQGMLPDQPGQTEYFGADDETDDTDAFDGDDQTDQAIIIDQVKQIDQGDQSMQATLAWMRQKLDEKDTLIREKEAKIETLAHELAGAHYRNGYLEAEKNKFEEQVLLLEDKSKFGGESIVVEAAAQVDEKAVGGWSKFSKWFLGR